MRDGTINRRNVLRSLGVAATTGLAGCGGSGDGGDGDDGTGDGDGGGDGGGQGERVPALTIDYFSGAGDLTEVLEGGLPIISNNLEELGVDMEAVPKELTVSLEHLFNDVRNHHAIYQFHGSTPERLDPETWISRYRIIDAGAGVETNNAQYVSCEFTDLAYLGWPLLPAVEYTGSTSVTTLPGQMPDASTSAMVSSASCRCASST
jgi:hypothetical protein